MPRLIYKVVRSSAAGRVCEGPPRGGAREAGYRGSAREGWAYDEVKMIGTRESPSQSRSHLSQLKWRKSSTWISASCSCPSVSCFGCSRSSGLFGLLGLFGFAEIRMSSECKLREDRWS